MKKIIIPLLLIAANYQLLAQPTNIQPSAGNVVYVNTDVNQGAPGFTGNGSSWDQAVPELADALEWARIQTDAGTASWDSDNSLKIYVAKGTYRPLYKIAETDANNIPTLAQDRSFRMVPNVQLYGGFAAGETDPASRNFNANETTLTGDINGTFHAYHVVLMAAGGSSLLDGFTITNGRAVGGPTPVTLNETGYNLSISRRNGGGIYIAHGMLAITRVIVKENTASEDGAGIYYGGVPS